MVKAKQIDVATVTTQQGLMISLRAMDDGSVHVIGPPGTTAWSVISLFSGASGTRLRMAPRELSPGEEQEERQ